MKRREPHDEAFAALVALSEDLEAAGDREGALAILDRAVELYPARPRGWALRGYLKYETGDYIGAITDFSAALSRKPLAASTLFMRGRARENVGDAAGAAVDFLASSAVDGRTPDVFVAIGRVVKAAGHPQGAVRYLRRALEMSPDGDDADAARELLKDVAREA